MQFSEFFVVFLNKGNRGQSAQHEQIRSQLQLQMDFECVGHMGRTGPIQVA